jgi:hypothetical protein
LSAARLTRPLRNLGGGHRGSGDVVDVNAVTARTASALERMLGPSIEVTLALDNGIERIKIGAAHLEEIVLNLGIHARDAMPNGGRLTVATTMHMADEAGAANGAPRAYVRMVIGDTGRGMSAAEKSRLFEPFLAADDAAGSAMGLARVDAIVKQAGGRIQVESTAGVGTTFTIDLPATSEAARPPVRRLRRRACLRRCWWSRTTRGCASSSRWSWCGRDTRSWPSPARTPRSASSCANRRSRSCSLTSSCPRWTATT